MVKQSVNYILTIYRNYLYIRSAHTQITTVNQLNRYRPQDQSKTLVLSEPI